MRSILIDAGPVIALFRKNDSYHERALEFIKSFKGRLITTWPVITEIMYELNRPDVQEKFMMWIKRGGLEIANIGQDTISDLLEMIRKYSDVHMDLADATLLLYAIKTGISEIATIDSDFNIYRTLKNEYLKNVFL